MQNSPLPRLDEAPQLRAVLRRHCRLRPGEVWQDPTSKHRVGCLDASRWEDVQELVQSDVAQLALHDPPYNLVALEKRSVCEFTEWCRRWIANTDRALPKDASLYVWIGADQNEGFQPLPDFMLMMRETGFRPRSFITMRNQRGYGTQKNWMAGRRCYTMDVDPVFCEIVIRRLEHFRAAGRTAIRLRLKLRRTAN